MSTATSETAPTLFLEAGGIRFAYRRFGSADGGRVPLVFFNHFRGNLDTFDPAITGAFAAGREVVLFDNAGVGQSSGAARDTVPGIAADAVTFLDEFGLDQVDVLGHSMGGEWAQLVALERPSLVRRLILVGTGPRGGEGMSAQRPSTAALFARQYERQDEMWLPIFFSPSQAGQEAGRRYLDRIRPASTTVTRPSPRRPPRRTGPQPRTGASPLKAAMATWKRSASRHWWSTAATTS